MQCPECGSHYTQSVPLAYSQSIRTGYNGNQTISEFGQALEPPEPRSEFLVPLLSAAFLFGVIFFFFPTEISWLSTSWVHDKITSLWGRVSISGGLAFALLIFLSGDAIAHNTTAYAEDMDEWEATVVCRRCGEQFSR
jgi:hypothetical protein